MAMLHLNLKVKHFDAIARGVKPDEFRLCTPYWCTRIEGRTFDGILVKRAYPRRDDTASILFRPWRGYVRRMIQDPEFGAQPVEVFAIRVNDEMTACSCDSRSDASK
jgi:hypothetical protein